MYIQIWSICLSWSVLCDELVVDLLRFVLHQFLAAVVVIVVDVVKQLLIPLTVDPELNVLFAELATKELHEQFATICMRQSIIVELSSRGAGM